MVGKGGENERPEFDLFLQIVKGCHLGEKMSGGLGAMDVFTLARRHG